MTAYVFTISSLETGRTLGAAVVAPQARYASIAWRGAARIERWFLPPASWLAVERAGAEQLEAGPLPHDSPFVQALRLPNDQVLQYLSVEPVGAAGGLIHVEVLDARLRAAAAAFGARVELVP